MFILPVVNNSKIHDIGLDKTNLYGVAIWTGAMVLTDVIGVDEELAILVVNCSLSQYIYDTRYLCLPLLKWSFLDIIMRMFGIQGCFLQGPYFCMYQSFTVLCIVYIYVAQFS